MFDLTSFKYAEGCRTNYSAVNPIQQNIRCYTNKTVKSLGESQSNTNADYLVVHPAYMLSSTGKWLDKVLNTCTPQGKPKMIASNKYWVWGSFGKLGRILTAEETWVLKSYFNFLLFYWKMTVHIHSTVGANKGCIFGFYDAYTCITMVLHKYVVLGICMRIRCTWKWRSSKRWRHDAVLSSAYPFTSQRAK